MSPLNFIINPQSLYIEEMSPCIFWYVFIVLFDHICWKKNYYCAVYLIWNCFISLRSSKWIKIFIQKAYNNSTADNEYVSYNTTRWMDEQIYNLFHFISDKELPTLVLHFILFTWSHLISICPTQQCWAVDYRHITERMFVIGILIVCVSRLYDSGCPHISSLWPRKTVKPTRIE